MSSKNQEKIQWACSMNEENLLLITIEVLKFKKLNKRQDKIGLQSWKRIKEEN